MHIRYQFQNEKDGLNLSEQEIWDRVFLLYRQGFIRTNDENPREWHWPFTKPKRYSDWDWGQHVKNTKRGGPPIQFPSEYTDKKLYRDQCILARNIFYILEDIRVNYWTNEEGAIRILSGSKEKNMPIDKYVDEITQLALEAQMMKWKGDKNV